MDRYSRDFASCGCNAARSTRGRSLNDNDISVPLAMPIMPIQEFRNLCSPCEALEKGTLFSDLYKPYCIKGGYRC